MAEAVLGCYRPGCWLLLSFRGTHSFVAPRHQAPIDSRNDT